MISDHNVNLLFKQSVYAVKEIAPAEIWHVVGIHKRFFELICSRSAKHCSAVNLTVLFHVQKEGNRSLGMSGCEHTEDLCITESYNVAVFYIKVRIKAGNIFYVLE